MNPLKKAIKPVVANPSVARIICQCLLKLDNRVDRWLNEMIVYANKGEHPKHRLMSYSQFFIAHLSKEDRVLDIGCGRGIVANAIAAHAKEVYGIDFNVKNIAYAQKNFKAPNLTFICGNALTDLKNERYDALILSSVLEHIEKRPEFLQQIRGLGKKALIRVPMIDRDWTPLLKKEWNIDYRLDDTHFTEYTESQFREELEVGGWQLDHLTIRFGEIWAVAHPRPS